MDRLTSSNYLNYLPAIYQESSFLGTYLNAFEKILSGLPDTPDRLSGYQFGLVEVVNRIASYFDPDPDSQAEHRAPTEFLPWLANWVALSLRQDWTEDERRRFISQIVPLYQWRGTKKGLKELLETYTNLPNSVEINEFPDLPHYFEVEMTISEHLPEVLRHKEEIAIEIIEQEKPAHTFYSLKILIPTMRIMNDTKAKPYEGIIVGHTTLLGSMTSTGHRLE